jgi:hypothetical protein
MFLQALGLAKLCASLVAEPLAPEAVARGIYMFTSQLHSMRNSYEMKTISSGYCPSLFRKLPWEFIKFSTHWMAS